MITVSVGVAAFPIHGLSVKELMASADAALYRAKREGRDRVVVANSVENNTLNMVLGPEGSSLTGYRLPRN